MPNNMFNGKNAKRGVFMGGFTANTIRLGPPLTITEDEFDGKFVNK